MTEKKKILYKGEVINITENMKYWELKYPDGSEKKIYHHVNAEEDAVWMWESGKIDEASLSIGKLIYGLR